MRLRSFIVEIILKRGSIIQRDANRPLLYIPSSSIFAFPPFHLCAGSSARLEKFMRGAINVPELMSVIKEVLLRFSGLTTFWKPLEFRIRVNGNPTLTIRINVFFNIFMTTEWSKRFLFFLKINQMGKWNLSIG